MNTHSETPNMQPTHVVTCFLRRDDQQSPRLLLVRRSARVGSYHDRWAGISGFVEPGVLPEEQAYTEIQEETHLQRDQVRMLTRGEVVEYVDETIERHWCVHPFLFEVLAPDSIVTDWEAVEMRWITPDELSTYHTVPMLQEAYESAVSGVKVV